MKIMKIQVIISIVLALLVVSCCHKRSETVLVDTTAIDSVTVVDTITIDTIIDCNLTFEQAIDSTTAPQEIIDQLELITVQYYSTDSLLHQGQILCNKAITEDIVYMFEFMKEKQFPIVKVIPISEYGWDDEASMQDNNTSCFNYRNIYTSFHSLGLAIDINPYYNPMLWKAGYRGKNAPEGAEYNPEIPGTLTDSSEVTLEFQKLDYKWGGSFIRKYDYQHFHKNGYTLPKRPTVKKAPTKPVEPKENNYDLSSLPLNLIKNYFRALGYYDQRYVEEWIVSKSQETGGKEFSVDLITNSITPKTFDIKEIRYPIGYAKNSITKTLESNNLSPDYVYKADLNIQIINDTVYCTAIVVDINDKDYSYESYKVMPKR